MTRAAVFMLLAMIPLLAADDASEFGFSGAERRRILRHAPLGPVPADETNSVADDERAAALGQFLFFDPRLSGNGELSCASCHDPSHGFTDGRSLAEGLGPVERNTLSLWNVAYNRWFYWDGRADSLWAQALNPIERPNELGGSRLRCAHLIGEDQALRRSYEALFGPLPDLADPVRFPPAARPVPKDPEDAGHQAWLSMSEDDREAVDRIFTNLGKAIAAYERKLVSRRSPFDRFAEGVAAGDPELMDAALSPSAQRGLKLFISPRAGCTLCHSGPNFSDGEFHSIGVPPRDGGLPRDPGRYVGADVVRRDPFNALGPFSDAPAGAAAERTGSIANGPHNWGQFKTPSLRNVARTAPYMHQGQFATLDDVLHYYSTLEGAVQLDHHQEQILKPLQLTAQEREDLRAFLESLTDEGIDAHLLHAPETP